MRIVLVGPPGAGKGTQAAYLAKNLSIPHISTGDLFRANISQGTDLGKQAKAYMDAGNLVPDEVTIGMAKDRMEQPDAANGFLLDGFPRNVGQAEALDAMPQGRGHHAGRGAGPGGPRGRGRQAHRRPPHLPQRQQRTSSTSTYNQPKTEGVCDVCGGELYQRDDDTRGHGPQPAGGLPHARPSRSSTTTRPRAWWSRSPALGKVAEVTERAMEALREAGEDEQHPS